VWLGAIPLLLSLTTASVTRDGIPQENARVCRFAAADRVNPFQRWFAWDDVACVPPGAIEFPSGQWNVFAESDDGVSGVALVDGDEPPPALSLALAPAAVLNADLPAGHGGIVYSPVRATALPLRNGRALVPASEDLWLFVVHRQTPVALVPVAAGNAGTEGHVDARIAPPWSVVGWLSVPPQDRDALARAAGLSPPKVHLTSGAAARESDPLPDVSRLDGAIVRIRNVEPGQATIALAGKGWVPESRSTKITSALTIADQPLTVRATGTLIVRWSAGGDVGALALSIGACDERSAREVPQIVISSCPAPERSGSHPDPRSCSVLQRVPFDPADMFGEVTVEDMAPGWYRAEARVGDLPPPVASARLAPLQQRDLSMHLRYEEIHGDLTFGGDPLERDAAVTFPAGYGFARGGRYRAALLALSGIDGQVAISGCEESTAAVVLTDEPMRRNTRFDLDIPKNRLNIVITDTFTGEPMEGATVRVDVMSLRVPQRIVMTRTLKSDQSGRVALTSLPEREIVISATRPGYQRATADRFTMDRAGDESIEIQMVPLKGTNGRIISARPFDQAAVYFYSASGREIERADVAADGTFIYSSSHSADETMVVVSLSHPLWIARAPNVPRFETITVRFPDAAARTFTVARRAADPRATTPLNISVGGLRVPEPLWRQHQFLRGLGSALRGPEPLRVAEIAETGPIEMFVGGNATPHRLAPSAESIVVND
jgi:hypothetical protein